MAEIKLLPCPFCSAPKEELGLTHGENGDEAWFIRCYVCHVETACQDTKAEAIAAWNTRAAHTTQAAEVERLMGLLRRAVPHIETAMAVADTRDREIPIEDLRWEIAFALAGDRADV